MQMTRYPACQIRPRRVQGIRVPHLKSAVDQTHERGVQIARARVCLVGGAAQQPFLLERFQPALDLRKIVFVLDGGSLGKRPPEPVNDFETVTIAIY